MQPSEVEMHEHVHEPKAFRRRLASLFAVDFELKPLNEEPFHADIRTHTRGRMRLASIAFSPHTTLRLPLPASCDREYFMVGHQQQGKVFVRQDGREACIHPGDIYVINASRDFKIETGDIQTRSVYVPAEAFRAAYPEVDCCTAMAFSSLIGPGRAAGSMLNTMFELAPSLNDAAADRYIDALPYALAIPFEMRANHGVSPSRLTLLQKERVKDFVRRNLRDNELDCDKIAKAVRLSPRYIYDLFADEPQTLMRWIWSERLARCRHEIELPAMRNRTIGDVAFSWGFIDLAHFSRSFRKAFGITPRECRNAPRRS